ncbi:hypothetical protein [Hymenobacter psoromatis]|uniref:hypothetical protein n=1 Tax=Hymenobacter psoromatis TaxID=1484116 RepID=UPI001CC14BE8|nr:hypothetical protein [Hymenobacter psoromatis]
MEKLSNIQSLFNKLEQLAEDKQGYLIGGFAIISAPKITDFEGADNCNGGNCVSSCGKTSNSNCEFGCGG